MQTSFTDKGVVLKNSKTGEADKIITILSQYHGLIVLRAPGARRPTSKKAGHLDSLNLIRFHVTRSRSPQILTQAETIHSFPYIKQNLDLTKKAFFCVEVINQLAPQDEPDQTLFKSLENLLTALEQKENTDSLLIKFLSFLLRHFGYPLPKNQDLTNLITAIEEISNRYLKSSHI